MTEKPSRCDSVVELLRIILRSEGPKALFRGLAPTLWAVVPFTLVQSATLDIIRDTTHALSALDAVVASALAGIVAQTVVFPLDTVHRSAHFTSDEFPQVLHRVAGACKSATTDPSAPSTATPVCHARLCRHFGTSCAMRALLRCSAV